MNKQLKRVLVFALGIIFLILGVIGLVLPFLQGILFLAIGIILLSIASPSIRDWTERHTRRFPKLHAFIERIERRIIRIIGD